MRLDQAIAERNPDISRRKAKELIAARRVLVNDRVVGAASREVKDDDRIAIIDELPDIAIIGETNDWLAVNKPPGMPTQPPRNRMLRSLEELLRVTHRELYVVHRIDTNTTGVVLFAKSRDEAAWLSKLFAGNKIRKTYLAVVEGELTKERTIDTPINEKDALTIVRPLAQANGVTLIEAEIRTGRTHQIRIHLSSIKHPVLGDRRYGAQRTASRPMLHAWRLEHATFGRIEAPLPDDLIRCAPPWSPTS